MEHSQPRPLQPDEWGKLRTLLQKVHGRANPDSYVSEYPLMLGPSRAHDLIVMVSRDGSEILCHAGSIERVLMIGAHEIPIALVGSVATHPAFRGQGLARRTLTAVHDRLRARGILLSFLWSPERTLYRQLGYVPIGRCLLFDVDPQRTPPEERTLHFRTAEAGDFSEIGDLLADRPVFVLRTLEEHRILSGIPGVEGYVAIRDQRVVALLYVGKGSDLNNIGHDWAGEPLDVIRLACWIRGARGRKLGLLTPDVPDPVAILAVSLGWPHGELPVALGKLLNRSALESRLGDALKPSFSVSGEFPLTPENSGSLQEHGGIREIFGPPSRPVGPTGRTPFFIWGLDSM